MFYFFNDQDLNEGKLKTYILNKKAENISPKKTTKFMSNVLITCSCSFFSCVLVRRFCFLKIRSLVVKELMPRANKGLRYFATPKHSL